MVSTSKGLFSRISSSLSVVLVRLFCGHGASGTVFNKLECYGWGSRWVRNCRGCAGRDSQVAAAAQGRTKGTSTAN